MQTQTIAWLLRHRSCKITTIAFNKKLLDYGILQYAYVNSTVDVKVKREYKRFTNFGREFGCDVHSAYTDSKTSQPRFYEESFIGNAFQIHSEFGAEAGYKIHVNFSLVFYREFTPVFTYEIVFYHPVCDS